MSMHPNNYDVKIVEVEFPLTVGKHTVSQPMYASYLTVRHQPDVIQSELENKSYRLDKAVVSLKAFLQYEEKGNVEKEYIVVKKDQAFRETEYLYWHYVGMVVCEGEVFYIFTGEEVPF